MLVSNFAIGDNSSVAYSDYKRTAGYSLQITNLEETSIEFGLEFWITHVLFPTFAPETTEIRLGKALGGRWYKTDDNYFGYVLRRIGANGVEIWTMRPSTDSYRWSVPQIAGYVSLRVPVTRSGKAPYELVAQSKNPIRVLLSAWREDDQYRVGAGFGDPSWSQSSIQLASGKAYNEIPPDTSLFVQPQWMSRYVSGMAKLTERMQAAQGAQGMRQEDAAQALIDLLGQLGDDKVEIDALNKALQDLKAPISVRLNRGGR